MGGLFETHIRDERVNHLCAIRSYKAIWNRKTIQNTMSRGDKNSQENKCQWPIHGLLNWPRLSCTNPILGVEPNETKRRNLTREVKIKTTNRQEDSFLPFHVWKIQASYQNSRSQISERLRATAVKMCMFG